MSRNTRKELLAFLLRFKLTLCASNPCRTYHIVNKTNSGRLALSNVRPRFASKHTTRIPLVPTLAQSFSMKGGGTKTKTKVGSNLTCGGDGAGGWYDQTPARLN